MPITAQTGGFVGVQEGHTIHLVERVPRPPPQAGGQPAEHPGQSEPKKMGRLLSTHSDVPLTYSACMQEAFLSLLQWGALSLTQTRPMSMQ